MFSLYTVVRRNKDLMSLLSLSEASNSSNHMCNIFLYLYWGNKHLISLLLFLEASSSRPNMCFSLLLHVGNKHRISLLFPETSEFIGYCKPVRKKRKACQYVTCIGTMLFFDGAGTVGSGETALEAACAGCHRCIYIVRMRSRLEVAVV